MTQWKDNEKRQARAARKQLMAATAANSLLRTRGSRRRQAAARAQLKAAKNKRSGW